MEESSNCDSLPEMVSKARDELRYLFSEAVREFWCVSYPPPPFAPAAASLRATQAASSPSTEASAPHPSPLPTTPRRSGVRGRPPPSSQWYDVVPDIALPGPADAVLGV